MIVFTTKAELRDQLQKDRLAEKTIGLVPTMGNLHAGHIKLVTAARKKCDVVVTTIFVNPLQFGEDEDLDAYPRSFDSDQTKLIEAECDYLLFPTVEEIYGQALSQQSIVRVPQITERYCGASRPGHFDGVATVVSKLFNIVQPHSAFFGLKDYQQFLVIRKLVVDLLFDIEIVGVEIQREESGLALSSRNGYLNTEQKSDAINISRTLQQIADKIRAGDREFRELECAAIAQLTASNLKADYFAICNADNLEPASVADTHLVLLAAAYVGPSRLIDNIRLQLDV